MKTGLSISSIWALMSTSSNINDLIINYTLVWILPMTLRICISYFFQEPPPQSPSLSNPFSSLSEPSIISSSSEPSEAAPPSETSHCHQSTGRSTGGSHFDAFQYWRNQLFNFKKVYLCQYKHIQGGPERTQHLRSINFKKTGDKINKLCALLRIIFFFQQDDTKIINFDEGVLILWPFFCSNVVFKICHFCLKSHNWRTENVPLLASPGKVSALALKKRRQHE